MESKPKVEANGNTKSAPIQIPVNSFEANAHAEAGTATDDDIKGFVLLKLLAQGAPADQADQLANLMAEAALNVRQRIREATRYELKVIEEPNTR